MLRPCTAPHSRQALAPDPACGAAAHLQHAVRADRTARAANLHAELAVGTRVRVTGGDPRFIGAEGTLGIITGAMLKLFPQPRTKVTALAALESRAIEPWTRLPCNGFLELGNIKFHCWLKGGHGALNVVEALAQSCDCFFYEAARRAGVDRIADTANRLGFGRVSELGLPGESAGIQPTRQWKQEKYSKPWQQGDAFNLGIGQGYMAATPLQLAIMTARIQASSHRQVV